jgi:hypothetical protein
MHLLLIAALLLLASTGAAMLADLTGQASIIDGDTSPLVLVYYCVHDSFLLGLRLRSPPERL